jgi:cytosine/uracil/thiamine/allantoin permease
MIRKLVYVLFGVPIALIAGFILINIISAALNSGLSAAELVLKYKFLLGLIIAFLIYKTWNPFKRKKQK